MENKIEVTGCRNCKFYELIYGQGEAMQSCLAPKQKSGINRWNMGIYQWDDLKPHPFCPLKKGDIIITLTQPKNYTIN